MSEEKKSFLSDFSNIMEIEIDNREIISLLELMVDSPFNFIAMKNIYTYISENYKEIKVSNILTEEELEILDLIYNDLDDILEAYDRILEDMKEEKEANQENGEPI